MSCSNAIEGICKWYYVFHKITAIMLSLWAESSNDSKGEIACDGVNPWSRWKINGEMKLVLDSTPFCRELLVMANWFHADLHN